MITSRALSAGLAVTVLVLASVFGGISGVLYLAVYAAATLPGWPIGWRLFGRGHPVAWVSGALLGYGLTALALWVPIAAGARSWLPLLATWIILTAVMWVWLRRVAGPSVEMSRWDTRATRALLLVLLLVCGIVALPYGHIGRVDEAGNRRYRAYFTADFVWHEALTAELARLDSPPRNPYLASQPLHYYWSYFLLPAAVSSATPSKEASRSIESYLTVNGLCSGLLFVAAIYLAAWAAVPRAGAVAAATSLALVAASAEGLYAAVDLLRRDIPLAALKGLNIDAITFWYFQGLTIDGLPRAIWYTPQHSMACALGLIALMIAARAGASMTARAAAGAGLALGLALTMSPFPAGAFTLVYAVALLTGAALHPRRLLRVVLVQLVPAAIVGVALLWCLANATFEGAGGAMAFGLSSASARAPLTVAGLALGPILIPTLAGIVAAAFSRFPQSVRPSLAAVALAAALFYGVTLVLEPIWIGWRAGNVFLVTAPGLAAFAIAAADDRFGRAAPAIFMSLLFAVGLPTTIIDYYNAQDTTNDAMGPGFRWTVVLSPAEQDALKWIDFHTPPDAIVQMSLGPRGRETWSLIPSFAGRRMAAGLPISLLHTPDYDRAAASADGMYAAEDAHLAWRTARGLGVDFVYVGRVEREAFGKSGLRFDARPDLFPLAFTSGDSAVYAVR